MHHEVVDNIYIYTYIYNYDMVHNYPDMEHPWSSKENYGCSWMFYIYIIVFWSVDSKYSWRFMVLQHNGDIAAKSSLKNMRDFTQIGISMTWPMNKIIPSGYLT